MIRFARPYLYVSPIEETVRQKKERKTYWISLGWEEVEPDVWRCATCKEWRFLIDCQNCLRCERCTKCVPIKED